MQNHVWLDIGDSRVRATFNPEQFASDKLAAVQYLRFPLDESARAALRREGTAVRLRTDHPKYRHETVLGDAARQELVGDLA